MVRRFIETSYFSAQLQITPGAENALRELQIFLGEYPESGDIMQGVGGLRKVRLKLPGRGKSGGARVIYLLLPDVPCIVFLYLYTKARQSDLSPSEKILLRTAAEQIKATRQFIP